MPLRRVTCLTVLTLLSLSRMAYSADAEAREKFMRLEREVHTAFSQKDYDTAIAKCREQLAIAPNNANANYNLACGLARLGKTDDALKALESAINGGFTDVGHMRGDDDLTSLKEDKRFTEMLSAAEKKEAESYEKGAEMPGLKMIDKMPEGGLRYRLRISEKATKDSPHRLIVWLHPSGGSMNNVIESMASLFAEKGYALLVVTKKQWMGWNGDEADKLLNKTLVDAAKTEGLSAAKPILMGFSAGGQLALQLWGMGPGQYGGLVVDAAYPIDMEKYQRGQQAPQPLPKDESIKNVPIFAICGGADGGTQMWKKVEDEWRKAGVPLTFKVVEGKGHTWLFGKSETEDLLKWLEEVKAKK